MPNGDELLEPVDGDLEADPCLDKVRALDESREALEMVQQFLEEVSWEAELARNEWEHCRTSRLINLDCSDALHSFETGESLLQAAKELLDAAKHSYDVEGATRDIFECYGNHKNMGRSNFWSDDDD